MPAAGEEGLARGRGPGARLPQCFTCSALPSGGRMGTRCQTWGCLCCLGAQGQLRPPPSLGGAGCRQPVQSHGECRRRFAASSSRAWPRPLSWRAGSQVLEPPSGLGCGRPRTWLACICWEAPTDTDAADADRLPWEGPWGGGGRAVTPLRTSVDKAPACPTARCLPTQEGHLPRARDAHGQGADQEGRVLGGLRSR